MDKRWARVRDILGRDPTDIEQELGIHLIRRGHLDLVQEVFLGKKAFTSPIGSLGPVADLILEKWNALERTHQEAIRSELQQLLWQIRGATVTDRGIYRRIADDLDVDTIVRGVRLASATWPRLDPDQRRLIRAELKRFRENAVRAKEAGDARRTDAGG